MNLLAIAIMGIQSVAPQFQTMPPAQAEEPQAQIAETPHKMTSEEADEWIENQTDALCDIDREIADDNRIIAEEKAIQKETGVIDMKKLHDASANKMMIQKRKDTFLNAWKKASGKAFGYSCE